MKIKLMIQNTIFKYTEDYVYSIIPLLNCEIKLYNHFDNNIIDKNYIYIFWVRLPDNLVITNETNNIYLFNTEQMCKKYENWSEKMNKISKKIKIIDFSNENLKYFNKSFSTYFLPYQVNYNELYNFKKNKDVCIISDNLISKRRKYIVDKLKEKNINVDIISGFGKQRDLKIFKYKIILNIGWSKCLKIFESIRCDRCVFNNIIVISETKFDTNTYHLKDHIIFEDYEKIPNRVIHTLKNYDKIYNNLFEHFDIQKIDNIIKTMSLPTVKHLMR